MWRLLKSEIEYNKYLLIGILSLPILFIVFAMNDALLFQELRFLKKYFWSMIVGIGTYALVYSIWAIRRKEHRERLIILSPLNIKLISISRLIFGIAPFIVVGILVELSKSIIPDQQIIFVNRINGQLGMMFMFLVSVDLVINMWFLLEWKNYILRMLYTFIFSAILLVLSIGVIYSVSTSFFQSFGSGYEELMFFIWGIILAVVGSLIFTKRKSFLV